MSCKSERLMFQAFLIVSFLADVCYSQEFKNKSDIVFVGNLAIDKGVKLIRSTISVTDGKEKTYAYFHGGVVEVEVDLGMAMKIKTVNISSYSTCEYPKVADYNVYLQNKGTNRVLCNRPPKPPTDFNLTLNTAFTCEFVDKHRYVIFYLSLKCVTLIKEVKAFSEGTVNWALNKKTKLKQTFIGNLDGDFVKEDFCLKKDECQVVVDLQTPHTIHAVELNGTFKCEKKVFYTVGFRKDEIGTEVTCSKVIHEPAFTALTTMDFITCFNQPGEMFQYVSIDFDFECMVNVLGIEVIGVLLDPPKILRRTVGEKPTDKEMDSDDDASRSDKEEFDNYDQKSEMGESEFNSALGMKIDWSCYLAIFPAVLFSSVSWIHHVLHQLSFLGTNLIGVVVGMQGRNNYEK